jgi:hypothetical protein
MLGSVGLAVVADALAAPPQPARLELATESAVTAAEKETARNDRRENRAYIVSTSANLRAVSR